MKKLLLGALLACLCCAHVSAQNEDDLYRSPNKKMRDNSFSPQNFAENCMRKSDNAQWVAIGSGTVTLGCLVYAGLESVRTAPDDLKVDELADWVDDRKNRVKYAYIGAGVFGAIAIISEAVSLHYKIAARKELKIGAVGNGVGLAFRF